MNCLILLVCIAGISCRKAQMGMSTTSSGSPAVIRFADDLEFLRKHTIIHTLGNEGGAQIAVAPAWQGRVMTSTAEGADGSSLGWIHRGNIQTGILPPEQRAGLAKHIHIFGGEERFCVVR